MGKPIKRKDALAIVQKLKNATGEIPYDGDYSNGDQSSWLTEKATKRLNVTCQCMAVYKIQVPEQTNTSLENINRNISVEELVAYSECFKKMFTAIYQYGEKHIAIKLYYNVLNRFSILELAVLDGKSDTTIELVKNIDDKALLSKFCVFSHNDKLHQIKDAIHFSDSSFFIIKPNFYKYWHPTIARLDLSDVFNQIMELGSDE